MGINLPGLDQLVLAALLTFVTSLASSLPTQRTIISPIPASNNINKTIARSQGNTKTNIQKTNSLPVQINISSRSRGKDESVQNQQIPQSTSLFATPVVTSNSPIPTGQSSKPLITQPTATTLTPSSLSSVPPIVSHTIYAKTTISSNGKTIHFSITFPSSGGTIAGTMSGDCSGSVKGHFDGPSTGNLNGSAEATCPAGFLSIPVSISYTGKMASADTSASIRYTISALGKSESGNTILSLSH